MFDPSFMNPEQPLFQLTDKLDKPATIIPIIVWLLNYVVTHKIGGTL